jgi:hypothetical protein
MVAVVTVSFLIFFSPSACMKQQYFIRADILELCRRRKTDPSLWDPEKQKSQLKLYGPTLTRWVR